MCTHPKIIGRRICSCGKCWSCRKRKINDWALRMEFERRLNNKASLFLTLTYNDEHLPDGGLLMKRDLQLFFKRLRRQISYYGYDWKIKYFASGEYGEHGTIRPHYHVALFGLPLFNGVKDFISKCWKNGYVDVKVLTFQNAKYVAKYINKNMQKEKMNEKTGEISKEFTTQSRRGGGLGFGILKNTDYVKSWFSFDNQYPSININGFTYCVPVAFRRKIKTLYSPDIIGGLYISPTFIIYYNDKIYETSNDFTFHTPGMVHKLITNEFETRNYSFNFRVFYHSFSEYFKDVRRRYNNELNAFKGFKEKYLKFYEGSKFDFKTIEEYEKFVYTNFSCLFQ